MDDIWIISWFNHTAFDANPIWKSPTLATESSEADFFDKTVAASVTAHVFFSAAAREYRTQPYRAGEVVWKQGATSVKAPREA